MTCLWNRVITDPCFQYQLIDEAHTSMKENRGDIRISSVRLFPEDESCITQRLRVLLRKST